MSTQERIDTQARNGRPDPVAARPAAAGRPGADRLPRPPGRRKPGLAVIAVLLIVLGAVVAGLLATRIDDRVPVLVARHQIDAGQQISSGDLAVAQVASSGVAVIRATQVSQVVGRYATATIAPGRLIDGGMLGSASLLTADKAAVGISLQAGRYPASGLRSGDVVEVIKTTANPKVLTSQATVGTVQSPGSSVFGSSTSTNVVVTLIVDVADAPAIASAAAASQASVVLLGRGESTGGG